MSKVSVSTRTTCKMKFSVSVFLSKYEQIHKYLSTGSLLPNKSFMKYCNFCVGIPLIFIDLESSVNNYRVQDIVNENHVLLSLRSMCL